MDLPAEYLVHVVQVETYVGTGAYGDSYASPVDLNVFEESTRKLVRNTSGDEVISETTLYGALVDRTVFTEKSRVTLTDGRITIVILLKPRDDGGLGAPQHVEVACE